MSTLQGYVALVTGSTSGIGLGIARTLAREGCHIVLNGFGDKAEIEALRADIAQRFGVQAAYSAADMAQPAAIRAMVADAQAHLGSLDVLVNNAGIQHVAPIEEFPDERWDAVLAINLSSAFHTIKAALPGMRQRGWGRIVNVASAHGLVGSAQKAAYVAGKHALVGLTKVVALETAQTQITCNAICPGWVDTPLVRGQIEARAHAQGIDTELATRELLGEKQPSMRFVQPEHIGDLVLFLCSPAGSSLTGAALPIDGGWTAH
ncbi:MAG: 3-hydroxybutyrate dehydrogenase [Chromatiales bacterium]